MTGRVVVELVADGSFRLCEATGELVDCWLPGLELPDYLPLDRGGFEDKEDAWGFKLAIDLIRSEAGMLDVSPEQIERERQALDAIAPGRHDTLDRFAARIRQWGSPETTLEDFAHQALGRMRERPGPVVEYRRQRVA